MQSGCTLSEAAVRLVQPAMYEVGRRWQEDRITVAQEHLATAISQNVLARAYMHATFAWAVKPCLPRWRGTTISASRWNRMSCSKPCSNG